MESCLVAVMKDPQTDPWNNIHSYLKYLEDHIKAIDKRHLLWEDNRYFQCREEKAWFCYIDWNKKYALEVMRQMSILADFDDFITTRRPPSRIQEKHDEYIYHSFMTLKGRIKFLLFIKDMRFFRNVSDIEEGRLFSKIY